jgi:septum formation protein
MMPDRKLVLASGSPRRRALLEMLGIAFVVDVEPVDETVDDRLTPTEMVRHLALKKSKPVSNRNPDRLVLAADTIVVLDNEVLGKPESEREAAHMLRRLSGRTHEVYTGVALAHLDSKRCVVEDAVTRVSFSPISDDEISTYVATGSPLDKAGAYGIQDDRGCLFVRRIEGDYYNVVGLPLNLLYNMLQTQFRDLGILELTGQP